MSLNISLTATRPTCVFDADITHNLTEMADACGIYPYVWRPDENRITHAHQLVGPLIDSLARLREDPKRFEAMNPSNGWGSYRDFVPWLEKLLAACKEYPNASISVSR